VRELVSGKRRWSSPPNRENARQGFRGWHERGYLPHRDEPGLTQWLENNPAKAGLVLDPKQWSWSSARFRDAYGRLCL
jgi:hypothetical protein